MSRRGQGGSDYICTLTGYDWLGEGEKWIPANSIWTFRNITVTGGPQRAAAGDEK